MDVLKQPGIVLNIDINTATTPFLNSVVAKPTPVESDLYPFIDSYANTQITDICLNTFCQYSRTPSKVWSDSFFKFHQKEENGVPVCYKKQHFSYVELYTTYNLDPFRIWFKRCREQGIRGWLSLRMNDCHGPNDITNPGRSDFFYEAREKGWMIGDDFGYYHYCFNYAVPEVREKMLAYIEEQLRQYPEADGLELDFMREPYCFSMADLPNGAAIMNDFIMQVRTLARQIEQESNRAIPIMIRVPRDLSTAMDYGLDVVTWVQEGWCDAIVPSPRWESSDSNIPIDQWKEALQDCPVYAGLEILDNRPTPTTFTNEAITRGYAHEYWSLGADKIYLYNYFTLPAGMPCHHLDFEDVVEIYRTCGHPETASQNTRRVIVTFQDIAIHEDTRYQPLPISISCGDSASITVATGPCSAKSLLLVGLDAEEGQPPQILCNGEVCCLLGEDNRENPYPHPGTQLFRYALPAFSAVRQNFTFTAKAGDVTVSYLEIETDNP